MDNVHFVKKKRNLYLFLTFLTLVFSACKKEIKSNDVININYYIQITGKNQNRILIFFKENDRIDLSIYENGKDNIESKIRCSKIQIDSFRNVLKRHINFNAFFKTENKSLDGCNINIGAFSENSDRIEVSFFNITDSEHQISPEFNKILVFITKNNKELEKILKN